MFKVREEEEQILSQENPEQFHTFIAKQLFLWKRARQDIQTATSFMTTLVRKPDQDDWKKLKRVSECLNKTKELELTLSVNKLNIMKWYIDVSHAVYPDVKGQTGVSMTLGKGSIHNSSIKQKMNTRSSTEPELVATYDAFPQILWTDIVNKHCGESMY